MNALRAITYALRSIIASIGIIALFTAWVVLDTLIGRETDE